MLRGIWVFLVFVAATVILSIPTTVVSILRPGTDIVMRLGRVWSQVILKAARIRIEYRNAERMTARLPCVYMANHRSSVDIWALASVLPASTRIVAKRSLFRIPFLGWALATSGFIPVDRSNRTRAVRSLREAAAKIRAGRPVLLFPEGTRNRTGGLLPFKKGPFHLALEAGVPVVPISISGAGKALPAGSIRVRPGTVRVTFGEPIEVKRGEPEDLRRLMEAVRAAIVAGLDEEEAGT